MLTHGYRRFEWKRILNNTYPPVTYKPENDLSISGTVKTVLGKQVAKGTVSLITQIGGPVLSQTTDEKGNFRFSGLNLTDTGRFVLAAVTDKGKNSTTITYNKQQDELPVSPHSLTAGDTSGHMLPYLQNHKEQWDQYAKYGLPNGRLLKEVKIKAVKHKDDDYPSSSLLGPGHADIVVHADQIENMAGSLTERLQGKTRGLIHWVPKRNGWGFIPASIGSVSGSRSSMVIILDGVEIKDLDMVNPQHVETVEVMEGANASIYGMEGGNGVIVITTKQGKGLQVKDITSIGILSITVQGFYKARLFYAPKYKHPNDYVNRKDLRSTIYWQPEVLTDKDGAASVEFYNADGTGNYRVVIEGIDEKGNIGRRVYRFKVE